MKKYVLLLVVFISMAEVCHSEPFMDKALSSWIGYPLKSIINAWGYPDSQQTIAGQNIYIWEERSTMRESTYERSYVKTDKKGRTYVDSYTSGGGTTDFYCRKIIEVDAKDNITGYKYKGNACPAAYYFVGKKLVNPDNDEWKQRKLEKQMQKNNR